MAVRAVIGVSPRPSFATGDETASGVRENSMRVKPITAFQKPMTDQGRVMAKAASISQSTMSRPPGESV